MSADGRWSLAYDLSCSNNPSHPYMRQHCMGVDGEFLHITEAHQLRLADRFGIPYARAILDRVREVVDAWPDYADRAAVPAAHAEAVRSAQQTLGRG